MGNEEASPYSAATSGFTGSTFFTATTFFFGRVLPWLPRHSLPLNDLLSPLPMIETIVFVTSEKFTGCEDKAQKGLSRVFSCFFCAMAH